LFVNEPVKVTSLLTGDGSESISYFFLKNLLMDLNLSSLWMLVKAVVPKLLWAVARIKVAIMSYYLNILSRKKKANSYNTDQYCGLRSALPPEASHITPRGVIYPQFGNHW